MGSICEIALHTPSDPEIEKILAQSKTIAIVGLSEKPDRPSYGVGRYLIEHGFTVYPVHPLHETVLGQRAFKSLSEIPGTIDIVNVFRKPEAIQPIAEEAVQARAKVLWLQEGIVNNSAGDFARNAGLQVVMDRCILKEHRRLIA